MTQKICLITLLAGVMGGMGYAQDVAAPATATAPAPGTKPLWDTSAHLGLTLTRGNSRTLLLAGDVQSTYKKNKDELNLGADVTYGEDRGVKSSESVHGFGQYNRLFTDRFFGYLRLEGLHDAVADVDYRFTLSPGVGYYFIKTPNTSLRGEVGPGYVYEKVGGNNKDYMTLRFAERFDQKINDRAKIWQSLEFLPQVDRFSNYVINAELGVETAITPKFTQRVMIVDTYRSEPAAGRQKNDIKLIAAIGYKF